MTGHKAETKAWPPQSSWRAAMVRELWENPAVIYTTEVGNVRATESKKLKEEEARL